MRAAFLSGIFCGQPGLPVDLLLVGRVNLNKLSDFLHSAEKMMGQEINYSVMTVDEFLLRRDTFDKFIKEILDYPRWVVVDELKNKKRKYFFMTDIQNLYLEFLKNFPVNTQPLISVGLAVLIIYSVFKVIKKDWIFLIALVILLPGSKTILQSVWQGIITLVKFLLNTK